MENQPTVKSNTTTLKKKPRRGAFTLKNENAAAFYKKVAANTNVVNDPSASGRVSPNVSNVGSEPRTPNVTPKKKKGVRFTNNTKKINQNTRGLVKTITLESAPYLNARRNENLTENNLYKRNLWRSRESMPHVSRRGRAHLPKELSRYYAKLIHRLRNSSHTFKNGKNYILTDERLTNRQQNMLIEKLQFNFGK